MTRPRSWATRRRSCRGSRPATPSRPTASSRSGRSRRRATRRRPQPRYTDASLVKRLEEDGIGRPSTYASIISTIERRGYVWRQGKALVPTFTAFAVTHLLKEHFAQLVELGFTGQIEENLDEISQGRARSRRVPRHLLQRRRRTDWPGLRALVENETQIEYPTIALGTHPETGCTGRGAHRPLRALRPGRRGRRGDQRLGAGRDAARRLHARGGDRARRVAGARDRQASAPIRRPDCRYTSCPGASARTCSLARARSAAAPRSRAAHR